MQKLLLLPIIALVAWLIYKYIPLDVPLPEEKNNTGYISTLNEANRSAKKNIDEAVQKETNKINETLMENQDLEFVKKYDRAIIKTSLGDIEIKFYGQDSPATVDNFLRLANDKFYDGIAFHRIIKGFMIQGGDPLSKADDWTNVPVGSGGPGYKFADEFNSRKIVRGSLAMANAGPNTNGSQFFIVTDEATPHLDGRHTNFGEVISGMEVVDKIENVQTNSADQPLEKIVINSIELMAK